MFVLPNDDTFFLFPVSYHPRTVMLVDDDEGFLKQLARQLSEHAPVVAFSNPDDAILCLKEYYAKLKDSWLFQSDDSIDTVLEKSRQAFYNHERFKGISTVVLDYEMPNKDGFAMVIETGETALRQPSYHNTVILTGKRFSEFDAEFAEFNTAKNFISKWDSESINQLLKILTKAPAAFQWMSYVIDNKLSRNPAEKVLVLRDGNFLPVLNDIMKSNQLCEFTLFDRQGSIMFLDTKGQPSWLFVRNETGIQNTISLAKKLQAPESVINALESRKVILSLYEEPDYSALSSINWDEYLLPASKMNTDLRFLESVENNTPSPYYYAYTNEFPAFKLDREKVVSYSDYLDSIND